ncbi:MAG: hypothetical protein A2583_06210 [Bdellovibrionales bacterium RIFOXYD1_FULL_53_11]|nr:MAG: hypothetical protein A2583_06210 [Bdellovibrionales bacterium RIFOXYD1_FULL_53_11]
MTTHLTVLTLRNASWFCHLRWFVVLFLLVSALLLYGGLGVHIGIQEPPHWLLALSAILTATNLLYRWHLRKNIHNPRLSVISYNLWIQIIIDLVLLTVTIHFIGSSGTLVPCAYLFHIVLACIFFDKIKSFLVAALSFVLYFSCLALEYSGSLQPKSLFLASGRPHFDLAGSAIDLVSISGLLFFIWFLTSRLSENLRQREHDLRETNAQLIKTQKEKSRHMLRTTHELKAPFAAIHANLQLLLNGYCGVLADDAKDVVTRVSARCGLLSRAIQSMLQLNNITTVSRDALNWQRLDLKDVLQYCIEQITPLAGQKSIIIESHLESALIIGVEDHMKICFDNILSNAIVYSRAGGLVRVLCHGSDSGTAVVSVEDNGIGIDPAKIPFIFDEYYRTKEAVAHNNYSTGLGLAIVNNIARIHSITIDVQSIPGSGSKFTLRVPTVGIVGIEGD